MLSFLTVCKCYNFCVIIFSCTAWLLSFMLSFNVIIFCNHFPPFFFFLKMWHTQKILAQSQDSQWFSDKLIPPQSTFSNQAAYSIDNMKFSITAAASQSWLAIPNDLPNAPTWLTSCQCYQLINWSAFGRALFAHKLAKRGRTRKKGALHALPPPIAASLLPSLLVYTENLCEKSQFGEKPTNQ